MSNVTIVNEDLLEANLDIIGHQVNGLGIMSGGIALQIKKRYPLVYKEYKKICNPLLPKKNLGKCQVVSTQIGDDKYIANLFG